MVALAGAKVLHELGHGLACKHFGGECHQIGLMLLVFTPCLYCDTSDSWMVRSKWQRAAIGAAGMAVELVLASVCTFVWWNTTPGLLHYLCLNTIFVCSVSTLIFNCNPLLRYDGYYILSDLVEVPNLGHKSRQAVKAAIQHYCLGLPWGRSALYPVRQRWLFIVYGIASASYKWIVLFAILRFVSTVFAPYGLQPVGELLIALSLCSLIGIPIWQAYQFFKTPGKIAQVQRSHITVASCFAAVILAIVVFVPLPHHVLATVTLQPRNATSVYVEVGGVLDEVLVEPGDVVAADTPLAHVTDVTVQFDTEKLRGQQQRLATKLRNLQRQQSDDDSVDQAIPHTQAALENIQERLQRVTARQDRLTLTAPIAGAVISPPTVPPASTASAELATWSGTPLEPMNRGSWLEAGTLFCLIGQPTDLEAVAVIEQSDADFVRMDQTVRIKLDEFPTHTWHGRVSEIAVIDLEVAPRELTSKAGGGLDTTTDASGAERPAKVSYQARIPLDDSDARLLAGVRGHARIRVGFQTLARRLARLLFKTFRIV